MSDSQYRKLYLDQLECIITNKEPGKDSMVELLRHATPTLLSDVQDNSRLGQRSYCDKLFKKVLVKCHPDKSLQTAASAFSKNRTIRPTCSNNSKNGLRVPFTNSSIQVTAILLVRGSHQTRPITRAHHRSQRT